MITRRLFFTGAAAALAAPAIVRFESLMPVRALAPANNLTIDMITREAIRLFVNSNAFLKNYRQFDDEFGYANSKIGSQLRIRLPSDFANISH